MSEEMLSSIRQTFKQHIADAMTFRGPQEPDMVLSHGKRHDRFQNDEVFHASQLQHNWTKEWCEYLDYIRTIDIFAQSLSGTVGTIRYIVSFSVRSETNGNRSYKKPSRLPSNYTSYRKHEQRSRSDKRSDELFSARSNCFQLDLHYWRGRGIFQCPKRIGFQQECLEARGVAQ